MAQRVAFNGTESPIVIDDEGHAIPGLDRGPVDTTSEYVKQAVKLGWLVLMPREDFDVSGSADEVLKRVGKDPEKARDAITAENAQPEPRTTLIEKLGRVAATDKENV